MKNLIGTILFIIAHGAISYSQVNWQLYSENDGIKLWLKDLNGTELKQFKLTTQVKNEDIKAIYNLLRDVEKMDLWYDKIESVTLLKKINENEGIYLLVYGLPFPFENRISTVKGKIDYDQPNGKIKVTTSYFPYKDIPKSKAGMLVLDVIASTWEVSQNKNKTIDITHSGYMHPKGNIPMWLINDGVTKGPIKTINSFKKMLSKYRS